VADEIKKLAAQVMGKLDAQVQTIKYQIEKDWKHFRYIQPGCGFSRRDNCISVMAQELNNLASRLNQDVGVFRVEK